MSRVWNIVLGVVGWGLLLAYLVVAARYCSGRQEARVVRQVRVVVRDSARQRVITPGMVRGWLEREGIRTKDMPLAEVDLRRIRELVTGRGYVRDAKVYTDFDGVLHIELSQRHPVARVNTYNGYNFYITDDGYILPLQPHEVLYVPVITGSFTPPFSRTYVGPLSEALPEAQKKSSENYRFFRKLINFVKFIERDDFWRAQIVQIQVSESPAPQGDPAWQEPQVEFVPRAGDHVVELGPLDDVEAKLAKLLDFYRDALAYEGWDGPKYINLKFRNQVICTK